jgi:hypothetical protein
MPGGGAKKRGRPKKDSSASPPPPPASLVALLQQDTAVVRYFQALQTSLARDVQVYKERAARWEQRYRDLVEEGRAGVEPTRKKAAKSSQPPKAPPPARQSKAAAAPATTTPSRELKGASLKTAPSQSWFDLDDDAPAKRKKARKRATATPNVAAPKEDTTDVATRPLEMNNDHDDEEEDRASGLQLADSSDEDDDNVPMTEVVLEHGFADHMETTAAPAAATKDMDNLSFPSDSSNSSQDDGIFTRPVLPLRGKERKTAAVARSYRHDDDDDDDTTGPATTPPVAAVVAAPRLSQAAAALDELGVALVASGARRDNGDILADVQLALRALARVAVYDSDCLAEHPPFCVVTSTGSGIRVAPNGDHPVWEGLTLTVRALLVLETWSPPLSTSVDDDDSDPLGLAGRDGLARQLMQTLRREVQEDWARQDRTARLASKAIHYHPDKEEEAATGTDEVPPSSPSSSEFVMSAKSLPHLSTLLERTCWARCLLTLYLSRNDTIAAVQTIQDYLLATVPCHGKEGAKCYPRLPPVLSLLVLEAMFKPRLTDLGWKRNDEKGSLDEEEEGSLSRYFWGPRVPPAVARIFGAAVHRTARIWRARLASRDDRIAHVAQVEVAAYERLLQECGLAPEETDCISSSSTVEEELVSLRVSVRTAMPTNYHDDIYKRWQAAYQLSLIQEGSVDPSVVDWKESSSRDLALVKLECWSQAVRQMYLREAEEIRRAVGTKVTLNCPPDTFHGCCLERLVLLWESNPFTDDLDKVYVLATLIKCAANLADGGSVLRFSQILIEFLQKMSAEDWDWRMLIPIWKTLRNVTSQPTVRVINLERRHDRWRHMVCQGMVHKFLVVRGVVESGSSGDIGDTAPAVIGGFALDGQGPLVGSPGRMAKLVQSLWRPHDMTPFDKDAPKHENMVPMHLTEVACALSHISCWEGCQDALNFRPYNAPPCGLVRQSESLRFLFHIAGYARGPPLRERSRQCSPAAVCLILEDDSNVVEDFGVALERLLDELPRDFHYCALGYGRPKSAPIVPFTPTLGIPTHLFYATGYLISAAGLKRLQEDLPVRGPIDAWLGHRQTKNFENVVGQRLGVGSHAKGGSVSRTKLQEIMDWEPYCATPPLCQQAIRVHENTSGGRRNWQKKDSNVVYSGHR